MLRQLEDRVPKDGTIWILSGELTEERRIWLDSKCLLLDDRRHIGLAVERKLLLRDRCTVPQNPVNPVAVINGVGR